MAFVILKVMIRTIVFITLSFAFTLQARAGDCFPALQRVLADHESVVTQETAELFKQLSTQPADTTVRVKITYRTPKEPDFINVTPENLEGFLINVYKQGEIESVTGAKLDKLSRPVPLPEAVLSASQNKKIKPVDLFQLNRLARGQLSRVVLNIQLKGSSKMSHLITEITQLGISLESLHQRSEVLANNNRRGMDLIVTQDNLLFVLEALKAYSIASVVLISAS